MQTFKRALRRILLFLLITVLLSAVVIAPLYHTDFMYYCDAQNRRSLAGSLDYLLIGASGGYCAFYPPVADEAMGVNSYNLSGGMLTWYGRRILLHKELARNPVKTVVFEISYNSLIRDDHNPWGDSCLLCRLDSPAERAHFIFAESIPRAWDHIYAYHLADGFSYYNALFKNTFFGKNLPMHNVNPQEKGFRVKTESLQIKAEDLQIAPVPADTDFAQSALDELSGMVDLCREKGIEVLLVVVPIPDYTVYKFDHWDDLSQKWQALSAQLGCPLFDFNLLRERYTLFRDAESFADDVHMSVTGAKVFTAEYARVMNMYKNGEDYSGLFYPDYASMIAGSPYQR